MSCDIIGNDDLARFQLYEEESGGNISLVCVRLGYCISNECYTNLAVN